MAGSDLLARFGRRRPRYHGANVISGSIAGTFSESAFGLGHNARAPDLMISFREISDADNRALTGPALPAFAIGPNGPESLINQSAALVHPLPGVIYADANGFTTGMGMHGAAVRVG